MLRIEYLSLTTGLLFITLSLVVTPGHLDAQTYFDGKTLTMIVGEFPAIRRS